MADKMTTKFLEQVAMAGNTFPKTDSTIEPGMALSMLFDAHREEQQVEIVPAPVATAVTAQP